MTTQFRARAFFGAAALVLGMGAAAEPAVAQWSRQYEQFYLPADHNWVFRRTYPAADRLFNAFDYGHAILYEKLYTRPDAPASDLEEREYDFITRRLLVSPPRLPVEEAAIEIAYVKLVPEAKLMFEWAHILHRQMYDVLADERLSQAQKDAEVAALLRYYRSRPDLAFSSLPKNMELMEGQYYSTAFRDGWPKFNGLIWGYHWLQVGLYEPLLTGRTADERQTGVAATVTRFRQMLENAPENLPRVMPMTAAVAPTFAARYPEAAIIFDNLHSMHDVISDILASPEVPRGRKREEIMRAAARYRDDTSFLMTEAEWREMAQMMGIQNMGGPVSGFLAGFPTPTVERGAVMAHGGQDHAAMGHGQAAPAPGAQNHAAMGHGQAAPAPSAQDHAAMGHGQPAPAPAGPACGMGMSGMDCPHMRSMMELHRRVMADPVIRERVESQPELRRLMEEMHGKGGMAGMDHGAMGHGQPAPAPAAQDHAAMGHGQPAPAPAGPACGMGMSGMDCPHMRSMMELHRRVMADPVIRERVESQPELRRLMEEMHGKGGMDHGAMGHGQPAPAPAAQDHAAMGHGQPAPAGPACGMGMSGMDCPHMRSMMELHRRMMADPVIRERVESQPELRRLMEEMHGNGGMAGMDHGAMGHGQAAPAPSAQDHAAMGHGQPAPAGPACGMEMPGMDCPHMRSMMELHRRVMADPVIRERVESQPELRRLMEEMHGKGGMAGMDHGAMGHSQAAPAPSAQDHAAMGHGQPAPAGPACGMGMSGMDCPHMRSMMELHRRMMADPVIRERVESQPELRRLMEEMHGNGGMEGMDHGAMQQNGAASDTAQALEFVVRLLADPQVEARIHADPRLHRLWSDPEVQRRLAELRARPAAAEPHQH